MDEFSHHIAPHAERATIECDIVAQILNADQRAKDVIARDLLGKEFAPF